jgi:hypothetical protein
MLAGQAFFKFLNYGRLGIIPLRSMQVEENEIMP